MYCNDNMLSQQNSNTVFEVKNDVKNKGFLFLDSIFQENGWNMTKNEMNVISFSKEGFETEYFEMTVKATKIYVSIPIKNSIFQYNTSFNDYYSACDYLEKRFKEFIV